MDENRGIYPAGVRYDCRFADYAHIAMENYYEAKECLAKLQQIEEITEEWTAECIKLERKATISIVFSGMCIESFLNDYAAACLGDKEFYDSFDMLPPEGKLKLICSFILKHKVEKDKLYYCRLKELIKARNERIHSKSRGLNTQERKQECQRNTDHNSEYLLCPEYERKVVKEANQVLQENVQLAHNGIEAIKEIALLFDCLDPAAYAISRVFRPNYMLGRFVNCPHPIDKVLREFKIGMN